MIILLLGKFGQLGWELYRTLSPLGEVVALDYPEIDLAAGYGVHGVHTVNTVSIRETVREVHPQVIVNATAYTAVDRAESEPVIAMAVNGRAPGILAEEAAAIRAALIHYSTDYIFDGTKGSPYLESDIPNPLGVYGQTKLAGENAIQEVGDVYLILRTSWVYSLRRESFVTKVLAWSRKQTTLRLVTDQVSNPTWARMLAEVTAQMIAKGGEHPVGWLAERSGIYHLAGSGYASRMEWAQAILRHDPKREEQLSREILPAVTADFPTPARRPLFSALNCERFTQVFGLRLPDWEAALHLALDAG